jgi:hypothetical protein
MKKQLDRDEVLIMHSFKLCVKNAEQMKSNNACRITRRASSNLCVPTSMLTFATEITVEDHRFLSLVPESVELVCQLKLDLEKM